LAYAIAWEAAGVRKRFSGHVTDEEPMRSVVEVESDPRFDDLRYVVNDFLAELHAASPLDRYPTRIFSAIDQAEDWIAEPPPEFPTDEALSSRLRVK
jgi:hypothetical protein